LILFGRLDGRIFYGGAGLTPMGKEPEAKVGQMLASASAPARTVSPEATLPNQRTVQISAEQLRTEMTATTKWITERLHMGTWTYLNRLLCRQRRGSVR